MAVRYTRAALRDIRGVPQNVAERVRNALAAIQPNVHNPNVIPLTGVDGYRLRVGDWRALFYFDNGDVIVTHIRHRREAYR